VLAKEDVGKSLFLINKNKYFNKFESQNPYAKLFEVKTKYPNKLVLSPCNPMYDDLVYTEEQLNDIRILGKAVIFVSTVR
jgi:hypothetical protein